MLHVKKFIFNPFQENTYLAWDDSLECVILDPGCLDGAEKESLHNFIKENGLKPQMVLLTHGHLDHIWGVRDCIDRYGIDAWMDSRENASITNFNPTMKALGLPEAESFEYKEVSNGLNLSFGQSHVRALSTPGHSRGGVCWWFEADGVLFSGDTLFAGSIGRTDNPWASWDELRKSLKETLMALDGAVDVLPGHGPATSIGDERLTNPFINDEFGELGYEM